MSQPNLQFRNVVNDAFRQLGGGSKRFQPEPSAIEVKFYPYAGLHHTIRVRGGRVFVRISDLLETAPPEVIRALAFLLVARLLSRKAPRDEERVYRAYAFSPDILRASDLARKQRGRKVISSANGRVYDLDKLFSRLNRRYFDGEMNKPVLTWSQRRARSILGHHDAAHDTITISKALDSADVPEWFVDTPIPQRCATLSIRPDQGAVVSPPLFAPRKLSSSRDAGRWLRPMVHRHDSAPGCLAKSETEPFDQPAVLNKRWAFPTNEQVGSSFGSAGLLVLFLSDENLNQPLDIHTNVPLDSSFALSRRLRSVATPK
jgi:hypothetical protein